MKKFSMCLLVLIVGLTFFTDAHSGTTVTSIESQAGVPVFGPSATEPVDSAEWGESKPSIELTPVDPAWPQATDDLADAAWITDDASSTPEIGYRLFSDNFEFKPSCTGSIPKGTIHAAANNSVKVYFNGDLLEPLPEPPLEATDVPKVSSFEFTPIPGENTFDFVVETEGAVAPETNPAGLIYKAVVSSDSPNVVWLPPIVKSKRMILKDGTTLPIKFRLVGKEGLVRTAQNIYLVISEITSNSTISNEVTRFELGRGARSLRFARGNGMYITNFKTKLYNLSPGAKYAVEVKDGCSDETLGSLQMQLFSKKNPGKDKHQDRHKK